MAAAEPQPLLSSILPLVSVTSPVALCTCVTSPPFSTPLRMWPSVQLVVVIVTQFDARPDAPPEGATGGTEPPCQGAEKKSLRVETEWESHWLMSFWGNTFIFTPTTKGPQGLLWFWSEPNSVGVSLEFKKSPQQTKSNPAHVWLAAGISGATPQWLSFMATLNLLNPG